MATSDFKGAQLVQKGSLDGLADPSLPINYIYNKPFDVTDGGTAGTGVAEAPAFVVRGQLGGPGALNLAGSVYFTPQVAVTASDTLFITVNVYKRTGTGSRTLIATVNTKTAASGGTGNLSAFVPVLVPFVVPLVLVAAGDMITYEITKASTGTAFSAATGNSVIEFDFGGPV